MAAHPGNLSGLSLCAGSGALDLAVHVAEPRLRTVCYVEREAYAAACLVARMEEAALDTAPVWDDVATFDAAAWCGVVDLVLSGDPCQPNSVAGRKRGADDDRWLADHIVRIFDESGADRLFRENVPGNAHGQLEYFVPALEGLGCRVAVGIFSASEVGASHRRERLFIMADRAAGGFGERGRAGQPGRGRHADGGQKAMADAADDDRRLHARPGQPGGRAADPRGRGEAVGNPGRRHEQRRRAGEPDEAGTAHRSGRAVADAGRERPQGVGEGRTAPGPTGRGGGTKIPLFAPGPSHFGWPHILEAAPHLEPALRRMADGVAGELDLAVPGYEFKPPTPDEYMRHALAWRTDRLRLTGNGVVVLQAAYAYRTLSALLAEAGAGAGEVVVSEAAP